MKRSAKIYMVLLVWIAAALQFFINEKMDIEEVFAEVQEADAQRQDRCGCECMGCVSGVSFSSGADSNKKSPVKYG